VVVVVLLMVVVLVVSVEQAGDWLLNVVGAAAEARELDWVGFLLDQLGG
jgi:hypothetical protein